MKKISLIFCITGLFGTVQAQTKTDFKPIVHKAMTEVEHRARWQMVWGDEFLGKGLPDERIWNYAVGGHGWGNRELQYYTEKKVENVRQENGILTIECKKENIDTNRYTSARINTKIKATNTYGRWEVKAKFTGGKGVWPAIWLMPSYEPYGEKKWPDNGEIDIMEHVGWKPGTVHGSVHTRAYHHSIKTEIQFKTPVPDFDTAFHVYAVEVSQTEIKFFVDNVQYGEFKNDGKGDTKTWPFDLPMHVILNMAYGGWGAEQGLDDSRLPAKLWVDYVRCYKDINVDLQK